jgi:uncharacterized protein (TIGR03435 family)
MERLFLECAIRAALLVAGTAIVLLLLRVKDAAAQHKVWTGVVVLMLLLPAWTAWGPKATLRLLPPKRVPTATIAPAIHDAAPNYPQLEMNIPAPAPSPRSSRWTWQAAWLGVYFLGLAALLLRLAMGAVRARRLVRRAILPDGRLAGAASIHPGLQVQPGPVSAPVTVGWFRPRVILPQEWHEWPPAKLDAVLAHEGEHARRRDPLVQGLALLNRAIFWFHPAAWWLERHLSSLAEEACDDVVLVRGHNPSDYSEYLMDMARAVMRAGTRVNVAGVAMSGSSLPRRIRRIVEDRPALPISGGRMAWVIAFCSIACAAFASGTLDRSRPLGSTSAFPQSANPNTDSVRLTFTSESLQINHSEKIGTYMNIGKSGEFSATNASLRVLMATAYGLTSAQTRIISAAPDWIDSISFDVKATTDTTATREQKVRMLQSLLTDRFGLAVHRQEQVVPTYSLQLSEPGRLGPQLRPHRADAQCWDSTKGTPPPPREGEALLPFCDGLRMWRTPAFTKENGHNMPIKDLSAYLGSLVDRPVVDSTGLSGAFDFDLTLKSSPRPVERMEPSSHPAEDLSSYFEAFQQQLGLRLVPQNGPVDILVVDHVERPSLVNAAQAQAGTPANAAAQQFVDAIIFDGNRRTGSEQLASRIFLRPGDRFNDEILRRDYEALWNSQLFDDIRLELRGSPDRANHTIVIFHLKERPVIRQVEYRGFAPLTAETIAGRLKKEDLGLVVESPLNPDKIKRSEIVLKQLLAEHGRPSTLVRASIQIVPATNAVRLTFSAVEGPAGDLPRFESGSIKVATPDPNGRANGGWLGPGPFTATNATLRMLIGNAYELSPAQGQLIAGAPDWMDSVRFDIAATAEGNRGETPSDWEQKRLMAQSLLADRFKLAVHHETQVIPVYSLEPVETGKTGPHLLPHSEEAKCITRSPGSPPPSAGTALCGGTYSVITKTTGRMTGNKVTMEQLADTLGGNVDRPVLDRSGLAGEFDYDLSVDFSGRQALAPFGHANPSANHDLAVKDPSLLFEIVRDQLGLKLVPTNGPVDVLVIDHVEMPEEGTF